jgi:uncharacterized phiE125 gp8 family phage protein
MPEILITAPIGECIHVDEARSDRRIDGREDDAKLKALISAARQAAESKTRQQLLHARWQYVLDAFPAPGCAAFVPIGASVSIPPYAIRLPHSPLVSVEKIEYLDMDESWKTVSDTDYVVNSGMTPAIITPRFGKIWPIPLPQIGSVKVTYTAGYASPIQVGGALATNQFRVSGPVAWAVGDYVQFFNSGGVLPAPLCTDVRYQIATAAGSVYTLTDDSGTPVTFSNPGIGRSFIGIVPEGIRSWMLLRVGSLYENREEVAILNRGQIKDLPYVDGLLDPFISGLV